MFKFAQPVIPSTYFIPLRLILYFTILQYYNITIFVSIKGGLKFSIPPLPGCKALDVVDEPAA